MAALEHTHKVHRLWGAGKSAHAHKRRRKIRLPLDTRMSIARTRLSFERTLMSWVRTSAAMITFGFTLAQADRALRKAGEMRFSHVGPLEPRTFAIMTIVIGLTALLLATIQSVRQARRLDFLDPDVPVRSIGQVVAVLFFLLGVTALVEVVTVGHH